MSDTTAPVLLGLTLPSSMDVKNGSHAALVTARAQDDTGVRQVTVYFDHELSLIGHYATVSARSFSIPGPLHSDSFQDATPTSATGTLSLSDLTAPGAYQVFKVVVEDLAGNRTVYAQPQLQAMGINTTLQVSGGIADTAAPSLLKLNLPRIVNVGGGAADLALGAQVRDPAGGSGVERVTLGFDKPLHLGSGPTSTLVLGAGAPVRDGSALTLETVLGTLTKATVSGTYNITSVAVTDASGNTASYTPAQLEALGMNTALTVIGGGSALTPDASLSAAATDEGMLLVVGSNDWRAAGGNSFQLVVSYNPELDSYAGVSLAGAQGGQLSASVSAGGGVGKVTISGTGLGAAEAASRIQVAFQPLAPGHGSTYTVEAFTVNGQAQTFAQPAAVNAWQGGADDERIALGNHHLLDGGDGFDTVDTGLARDEWSVSRSGEAFVLESASGATRILAGVERLLFGEEVVELDTGCAAGQVYRLYQAAFGRAPDRDGIGYWTSQVEHGASLRQVAEAFINSAEFVDLYGGVSSAQGFVIELYDNVLHRLPDQGGLEYWTTAIQRGATRAEVLASFTESPEFVAQMIGTLQDGIDYTLW